MTARELGMDEIKAFWEWVNKHKDYVGVQYYGETEFWLYIGFDEDTLNSCTDKWQYRFEEGGSECTMMMNCICFKVSSLESGFGFTMTQLWEGRPNHIEDTLGDMLY